jgi:hypothetical protein
VWAIHFLLPLLLMTTLTARKVPSRFSLARASGVCGKGLWLELTPSLVCLYVWDHMVICHLARTSKIIMAKPSIEAFFEESPVIVLQSSGG